MSTRFTDGLSPTPWTRFYNIHLYHVPRTRPVHLHGQRPYEQGMDQQHQQEGPHGDTLMLVAVGCLRNAHAATCTTDRALLAVVVMTRIGVTILTFQYVVPMSLSSHSGKTPAKTPA